jgi:hyperosmotically inducible periplasmic protein
MKRLILVVIFFIAMVSIAYGQDVASALKDKATVIAKEQATVMADDTAITAEVKIKLSKAPSLKDVKIEVSTTEGVVTLTGNVKTKQAKGAATKIAKAVKGVTSVDNNISIEKPVKKAKKPAETK